MLCTCTLLELSSHIENKILGKTGIPRTRATVRVVHCGFSRKSVIRLLLWLQLPELGNTDNALAL